MTARVEIVAALATLLDNFMAANPTLLRHRFTTRPPSLVTDLPCAYIDLRPETIHYDSAIRDRVMSPSIVFVDQLTDNQETLARFDLLVDTFTDYVDANPFNGKLLSGNAVWSDATWNDERETLGGDGQGAPAMAARFTFVNVLYKATRL